MSSGLERHIIEVQGETIDDLRRENERLRELLSRCQPQIEAGYGHGRIDRELILELEKAVSDESK